MFVMRLTRIKCQLLIFTCFILNVPCGLVTQSHSTLVIPWTATCQAPLSIGFLSPGDLPNSGIKHKSPALAGGFFMTEPPRKSLTVP